MLFKNLSKKEITVSFLNAKGIMEHVHVPVGQIADVPQDRGEKAGLTKVSDLKKMAEEIAHLPEPDVASSKVVQTSHTHTIETPAEPSAEPPVEEQ